MKRKFSFSSPQRRGPDDPWFRVGQIDVTTTVLVVALGVLSMFIWAANNSVLDPLILETSAVRRGELWRLVTWPIANAPSFNAAISLALFWYFGRSLEELFGRVRFAKFLLILAIFPSLLLAVLSFPLPRLSVAAVGLSLIELGVFVAYVAERPETRFFFGIKAWVLAVVIVGIQVLQLVGYRDLGGLLLLLFILATALLLMRAYGFANEQTWIPKITLPKRTPKVRGARDTAVVQGPWQASPSTMNDIASQAEMDRLLDKIAATGMDSLSGDEKRRLKAHSKRLRGDG